MYSELCVCVCVCQLGQYIPRLSVQYSNLITLANCSDLPQPDAVLSSVSLTLLLSVSSKSQPAVMSRVLLFFPFISSSRPVLSRKQKGYPDRIKSRKRRRAPDV